MSGLDGVGIAFVNSYSGPGMGGGEFHLLNVARACREAGMRVHVLCEPGGELAERSRAAGLVVQPLRMSPWSVPFSASAIRRYLLREDVEIVHSGGVLANLVTRLAAGVLPVKVVTTQQVEPNAAAFDGGGRIGVWLRSAVERLTRRRVDRYVAVSQAVADSLVAGGVDRSRVRVVHNGVDAQAIRAATALPAPASLVGDGPLVGCVARLELVKGVDIFIRAAAMLSAQRGDVRFAVVGDGSQRARLEGLAASLGLGGRVVFTGPLSPALPALGLFDVCVVPSRSEGQSIVAVEAMTLGKPVVATRVGGLPEVVEDGTTGVLVGPDDPARLATAIGLLLDDAALGERLGRAGAVRAAEYFTLSAQVGRYLALFAELVA